jgi:hypothetical protein
MGYYENPPIINMNRGSEQISSSIVKAADSIAQGLMIRGERKREEEKQKKLNIQKLQERKYETDLAYNQKYSEWSADQTSVNADVDNKIKSLVQYKIKEAADARITLLKTTDEAERGVLLKKISNAEVFMNSAATFSKSLAEQTATWRLDTKAIKVGEVGGHVVNGATDEEILNNTAFLEILGGMNSNYIDPSIDISEDKEGDGVVITVTGKDKDGRVFNKSINSKTFNKSEAETEDSLLVKVEGLGDFIKTSKEEIVDDKGNIYTGYLNANRETVDLPSKGTSGGIGGDQYQIVNGQRLQSEAIRAKIKEKASATAEAMLASGSQTSLRTMLNYTLKQGVGYYDDVFSKQVNPELQKETLTNLLTDKAFNEMTKSLERTKDKNGKDVFWAPTADIRIKDKPQPVKEEKPEKPEPTTYTEEYYDTIIMGKGRQIGQKRTPGSDYQNRTSLVTELNKLSGKPDKYITREQLFKQFENMPYKSGTYDTGLTYKEYFAQNPKKGSVKNLFNKYYPVKGGKGYVLVKGDGGVYTPVTDYDIDSAEGRVKMALDQTSNETEKKLLQGKVSQARLVDWMDRNPIKQGETQEQYAKRARAAGF